MSGQHTQLRLSEVSEVIRGVSFGASDGISTPAEGYLPVLRAGNIQDSLETGRGLVWVPKGKIKPKQRILKNDIVMCTSSGSASIVGKTARATEDWHGSFGAFCVGIRADCKRCDPGFLYHYLNSPVFRRWTGRSSGANIKNIRKTELEEFEFPDVALSEQKRIAAILDKADAIRRKRRQAIQLAEKFLRSVFLGMFGDPVSNSKNWDQKKFESTIEDIRAGWSIKGNNRARKLGEWGVLKVSAVTSGRFLPEDGVQAVACCHACQGMHATPRKIDDVPRRDHAGFFTQPETFEQLFDLIVHLRQA